MTVSCDYIVGPPGVCKKLHVENLTRTSLTLVWEGPDFDGGSPVTGFYVEKRQGYSNRSVTLNIHCNNVVLVNYVIYSYCVRSLLEVPQETKLRDYIKE